MRDVAITITILNWERRTKKPILKTQGDVK